MTHLQTTGFKPGSKMLYDSHDSQTMVPYVSYLLWYVGTSHKYIHFLMNEMEEKGPEHSLCFFF